jgi:dihydroneopterin aldolase
MIITIERYPVFVKLGHFYRERLVGQEVLVSLEVRLSPEVIRGLDDNLEGTLDYGELFSAIDAELGDQEIKLVETAVLRLGRRLIGDFPSIASVEVRVEKPVLPRALNKGAKVEVRHRFERD